MTGLVEVAAGGLIGAPARFALDSLVTARTRGNFPWGTFVINASGALLLGIVAGLVSYHHLGSLPAAVVGTGFCGAYTTFSAFSYETVRLIEERRPLTALCYVAGSLGSGLLAAAAGLAFASFV